jgi:hypothetical protein
MHVACIARSNFQYTFKLNSYLFTTAVAVAIPVAAALVIQ